MMPGVVATVALFAALSPWIVRNYEVFHQFIPVRSGLGLELYIGNNGYSTRWVNSALHPNHSDAELAEYEHVGEVAYMDHKRQQANGLHPRASRLVCSDDAAPHSIYMDRLLEL